MNARSLVSAAVALSFAGLLCAQTEAVKPHGDVERVKVHGKSLEGNLEGDSPDREVLVYLPSSYKTSQRPQVIFRYNVRSTTIRVSWDSLAVRNGDNRQQSNDSKADRQGDTEIA